MTVFDPRTPSIARVYDYLLGGKDNFAADRAVAEKLLAVCPPVIETVPESRRFAERAVTWVAGSYLIAAVASGKGMLAGKFYQACNASGFATMYNHTPAELASFFGDLEIMPPGLGDARRIHPGWSELAPAPRRPGRILAGIARVPQAHASRH